MWYAIYRTSDGVLISTGTVIADPLPDGLASVELGEAFDQSGKIWNPTTYTFAPVQAELKTVDCDELHIIWERAKNTRVEAESRGVSQSVIVKFKRREDAAWNDYLCALKRIR